MKTVLKVIAWIFAIIVGLSLIVAAVGLIFFARNRFFFGGMMNFPGRMHPNFGPYMMYPRVGFGFSFLGWLIPLGLFVLLILGGIGIFLSLRRPSASTAMPAPGAAPMMASQPISTPVDESWVEPTPAPGRVCSHCGKLAQTDWVTCPYCSQSLTS